MTLAVAAVRAWTFVYTVGMPRQVAARRRAEIESDLWELQHDPDGSSSTSQGVHVLARLILGLSYDLLWRFEQIPLGALKCDRIVRVAATAAFLLTIAWVVPLWSGNRPHQHCITAQQAEIMRLNPSLTRGVAREGRHEPSSPRVCRP